MEPSFIHRRPILVLGLLAAFCQPAAEAGPLQQAEVRKIVNDVRIVDLQGGSARRAELKDVVKDDIAVRTGAQSRAELMFQDNTLTRLGADALFSFKAGTRDLTLDRGTMLLQVPKGLGGAQIRTAAVTAAITGTTIMVENIPGSYFKVVVLEGSLRLSKNGLFGEAVTLHPGNMVIVGAKEKHLPKPVAVDLAKLVKTSALTDPERFRGHSKLKVAPLPSVGLIQKEIDRQSHAKAVARLTETGLVVHGDGSKVGDVNTPKADGIGRVRVTNNSSIAGTTAGNGRLALQRIMGSPKSSNSTGTGGVVSETSGKGVSPGQSGNGNPLQSALLNSGRYYQSSGSGSSGRGPGGGSSGSGHGGGSSNNGPLVWWLTH